VIKSSITKKLILIICIVLILSCSNKRVDINTLCENHWKYAYGWYVGRDIIRFSSDSLQSTTHGSVLYVKSNLFFYNLGELKGSIGCDFEDEYLVVYSLEGEKGLYCKY
jgi:hypothetical protein